MANMTVTTKANFIPELWSKETIKAVEKNLVVANLVWRFDSEAKNGDTIHIPNVSNFTAQDKTAGVTTTPQATTEGKIDLSINTHKEVTFVLEDIAKVQASYDLMGIYTQKAGYTIAQAIDTSLTALASGFSQTKGTFNTAITTDVVLDSIELLDLADVPQDERYFVFQPDVKRDLLDIDRYVSVDFVNQKGVTNGMIGELYGIKTFMSTNVLKSGSNTSNMMFHKQALALALQQAPRAQSDYHLPDLGWRVTVDAIYGVVETRDTFGVLVKT
jgi:N4-gp56 family major capsid protein